MTERGTQHELQELDQRFHKEGDHWHFQWVINGEWQNQPHQPPLPQESIEELARPLDPEYLKYLFNKSSTGEVQEYIMVKQWHQMAKEALSV